MGATVRDSFDDQTVHGVRVTHAHMAYPDSRRRIVRSEQPVVRLHVALAGQYSVSYPELDRRYAHLGVHCSLFHSTPFGLDFVNESPELETFGVQFPVQTFVDLVGAASPRTAGFCEDVAAGRNLMFYEPSEALFRALEPAVRSMLSSRYSGALQQAYLYAQTIELLVRTVALASADRGHVVKTGSDRDRLFAARAYVDERLASPPRLDDVAKAVGLNVYKLKRGFKELFGVSVFGYLTSERLALARKLLLDTDKSAAEVAFALGYATPQHFHEAFKRQFGVTPKSVRKNP